MTVSIIIPTYNSSEFIAATLERIISVLNKIAADYEIIIVDDASKDNTLSVLNSFREKKDIKILKNMDNKGQQKSTLYGIVEARGEYIITIDDDLEYDPEDIKRIYEFIKINDYDLAYGVPGKIKTGIINQIIYKAYLFTLKNNKEMRKTSFRIIRSGTVQGLSEYSNMAPFILDYVLAKLTSNTGYLTVGYAPRKTSRYSIWMYLNLLIDNIRVNRKDKFKS